MELIQLVVMTFLIVGIVDMCRSYRLLEKSAFVNGQLPSQQHISPSSEKELNAKTVLVQTKRPRLASFRFASRLAASQFSHISGNSKILYPPTHATNSSGRHNRPVTYA
ncbi:hypothetical protein D8Y20_05655 [Mariprofundus sp. EBB-1]|uniref:hypothetical protein n=1 Tax=Mariprofundus sp. EBB-1 TaxID=2650971 RepID=UPI000EF1C0AB|nr:hypothetical protein [Mariprofundus sp. EBB-1]RLL53321.1 hypothetical protein D8Y20_05655 [Mariprofundus sp. EBB-1]